MSFQYRSNPTYHICVNPPAFVETAYGARRVDDIDDSVLLYTHENGLCSADKIYTFRLSCLRAFFFPMLTPVTVKKNTFGHRHPRQDTKLLASQNVHDGNNFVPAARGSDGMKGLSQNTMYTLLEFKEPTSIFLNNMLCQATQLQDDVMSAIGLMHDDSFRGVPVLAA